MVPATKNEMMKSSKLKTGTREYAVTLFAPVSSKPPMAFGKSVNWMPPARSGRKGPWPRPRAGFVSRKR